MPRLFITTTRGSNEPTAASIPFHIAVNGAGASGVECGIALAGDATELMKEEVSKTVRGVGVPPLADLLAGVASKGIKLYVWKGCAEARGVSQQHVDAKGATFITPPEYVRIALESEKVLTF